MKKKLFQSLTNVDLSADENLIPYLVIKSVFIVIYFLRFIL